MFSQSIRDFLAAPDDARRIGPYRCKDLLDDAGTAPVYRAVEEHAGLALREVAIKVFDIGTKPAAGNSRVVDEARALCRVQHPHVIHFHTLATDPKRGLMGLVMEFADGVSVEGKLAELAAVPGGDSRRVALAVDVGVAIASALAAAHEAGIVHRNVKPSNIMFTSDTYKLINFGIAGGAQKEDGAAKPRELSLGALTADAVGKKASLLAKPDPKAAPPIGTLGYVDPATLETTARPTVASDLYSLGATMYECIAGFVPAMKDGTPDKDVLLGKKAPTPLVEVAPGTPAALAKLVDSLVAPDRDERPRSIGGVLTALERVRSVLAGHERALPKEERGPFPGLERYEVADRDVLFGRSAEIAGVLELLRARGLVGIVGASGSGKSSLTRAGILPAIEEGALGGWPKTYASVVVTPGKTPMRSLRGALEKVIGAPLEEHPEAIAEQLAAHVDAKGEGLVILVDQLEEIVTKFEPSQEKDRAQALELLALLAEVHVGLRVVVAIRRDLLDQTFEIDPIFARALSKGIQPLAPLSSSGWQEVLDRSFEAYGYELESADLRAEILDDIRGREGSMTLVQFGLAKLWAGRDTKKKKIPRASLAASKGALDDHANRAFEGKDIPDDVLRKVLLAMTTPEGTRAHVDREALVARHGEAASEVVFALTKARLVVSEQEGFTFVHDSLLREWKRLRGWLEEAQGDRILAAHVERDAARWEQTQDPTVLWQKGRLAAATELWKADSSLLSAEAKKFVTASAGAAKSAERARFSVFALIALLIVGSALVYAKVSHDAEAQAKKDAAALATALEEVKALKLTSDENAAEAQQSAAIVEDLRKKMADAQLAYSDNVSATMKKVQNAKSLDGAQKATADLKAPAPLPNNLVAGLAGGPGMPKPTEGGPSAGAGHFDQASIERVVATHKSGVKRMCIDRGHGGAGTTKVSATITIAPNGQVQNVSTAGDDPVISKCIEQQLRGWQFPAPGESTTVQVPFVFVRQ